MRLCSNREKTRFKEIVSTKTYIDKTGLLDLLNERMSTDDKLVAISHARRFGKSQAAHTIDAYYNLSCDSLELFSKLKISQSSNYLGFLNKYNIEKKQRGEKASWFTVR